MRAELFWRRVQDAKRQREAALEAQAGVEKRLLEAEESTRQWAEAQRVIQQAAQSVQTQVHGQIADVVTRCLQAVFGPRFSFHIEFDRKRGKTEAKMFFKRGENEIDPTEESGLGMVDVACFALRIACLKLHQPAVAPVLLLDEPYRWLDAVNRPRVAELMEQLSSELGVQIICISHDKDFQVGNIIRVG